MTARLIRNAALAGLIACAPSCTSFEIEEGSGDLDKTPDAQSVTATIHGSFWGFKWVEPEVTVCKKNHELYRIEHHHNVLYVLAVATLGLYVPQSVEFWCVERPDEDGEDEPSLQPNPDKE